MPIEIKGSGESTVITLSLELGWLSNAESITLSGDNVTEYIEVDNLKAYKLSNLFLTECALNQSNIDSQLLSLVNLISSSEYTATPGTIDLSGALNGSPSNSGSESADILAQAGFNVILNISEE